MAFLDSMGLGKSPRERELEKEIRSLELRKKSVFSAINGEIDRLQRERETVLLAAGAATYEMWKRKNANADLTAFWEKIQELERQVEEQENKRTEMGVKYDEEISLINSNLRNMSAAPSAASVMGSAPAGGGCPNCGVSLRDDDIFCRNCGTRVR